MLRLIGILTGSAIAVAFLIVALGIPEFETPQAEAVSPLAATTAAAPVVDIAPDSDSEAEIIPQHESVSEPDAAVVAPSETQPEPEPVIEEMAASIERQPIGRYANEQQIAEQQWYAFWSPFRSELAADGFVSQLQKTTGLDYRVVNLKPGVYEVAFAYSDDSDIQDKLTQISSATGLDLSGS